MSSVQSTSSIVHKHDGHVDGYLNCIALRHGWTRTFCLSPEEVSNLEYNMLERILELSTLKLRSLVSLRLYVENPAGSRIFSKVRFWKDDGSLQSNLTKEFFEGRLRDGQIMRFEVRDGKERVGGVFEEDMNTVAADSAAGSEVPASPTFPTSDVTTTAKPRRKKSMSLDWFSRKGARHSEDKNANVNIAWRVVNVFLSFAGRPATVDNADEYTPLAPHGEREAGHADEASDAALQRKPSLRHRLDQSSSPFFASSATRNSTARRAGARSVRFQPDSGVALDGGPMERRSVPAGRVSEDAKAESDSDANPPVAPPPKPPPKPEGRTVVKQAGPSGLARLRPFLPKSASTGSVPRRLKRRKHDKTADEPHVHFKGADVVKRPEDAWAAVANSRSNSRLGHFSADGTDGDPTARVVSIENLLDDDDPFRG